MAEARDPGPLPGQIFRSRPERARRVEQRAELLTEGEAPVSAPQTRELSVPGLRALTRCRALPQAAASFLVSVVPLLFASILISPPSLVCAKPPWISLISVWAWACGAALILRKRRARAFREASALASPPLHRQICSPALPCEGPGIPVRPRYRRWSTLLLLSLLWDAASAIFFLSERTLFSFATCRLLILHGESRLVLFPESRTHLHRYAKHCGQEPGVFSPIYPSTLLLPGSEIFSVLETAKKAPRSARTHPPEADSFLRRRLAHKGNFQGLRRKRTQL
jgi:hypothetical protein